MIKLKKSKDTISILYNDKLLFKLNCNESLFSVGKGTLDFPMKRGSFRYKHKITNKTELFLLKDYVPDQEIDLNLPADKMELFLTDKDGKELFKLLLSMEDDKLHLHLSSEMKQNYNCMWFRLPSTKEEGVYGCGETYTSFNLRKELVRIWVAEHQNVSRISKKLLREICFGKKPKRIGTFEKYESYYAQPTFISSRKYYLHVDSDAYMEFDFRQPDYHCLMIMDMADIYLGFGDSFDELASNLSSLLGRQPVLPKWIYDGAILGIQGGLTAINDKLIKSKEADLPVCGVWCQDWEGIRITAFGKQLMWNWEYDRELYPKLPEKIKELHQLGIRFLGYINPFLAIEKNLYQYASNKGYCVKDKEGKDYLVKITTFPAAMVDFTNPDAYEWIKNIIKENMIGIGMDGWMADFGEYLPTDCVLFDGGDPKHIHNTWPAIWAKINREAMIESGKSDELVFFTRAGHTKTIQYSPLMWNGDQHVDFSYDDGLASVIPASLSLSVSSFGISHSDVGGYTTMFHMKRNPELLLRWAELSAFSPVFRSHEGNQPEHNVQFDDPNVISGYARMTRIHKGLADYLREQDIINSKEGIPVMRPLFFYYDEPEAYQETYEYLLGRDILVAPVLDEESRSWEVYLPDDTWIHIFSGKIYSRGKIAVNAPIGEPPVFIRSGSKYKEQILKLIQNESIRE